MLRPIMLMIASLANLSACLFLFIHVREGTKLILQFPLWFSLMRDHTSYAMPHLSEAKL